jgi:hypothetical protein
MDAPSASCATPFDSCFAEQLGAETSPVRLFPLLNRSTVDLPIRTLNARPVINRTTPKGPDG